jgi:hypothetical protein
MAEVRAGMVADPQRNKTKTNTVFPYRVLLNSVIIRNLHPARMTFGFMKSKINKNK